RRLPWRPMEGRCLSFALALLGCACASRRPALGEASLVLDGPTVVPLLEARLPLVSLSIEGRALDFLVDSGSTLSFVDPRGAQELGLELKPYSGSSSTTGSNGGKTTFDHYVPVERLELGDLVLEHSMLPALDDAVLHTGSYSGILGQDLLARLVVVVDMERR